MTNRKGIKQEAQRREALSESRIEMLKKLWMASKKGSGKPVKSQSPRAQGTSKRG